MTDRRSFLQAKETNSRQRQVYYDESSSSSVGSSNSGENSRQPIDVLGENSGASRGRPRGRPRSSRSSSGSSIQSIPVVRTSTRIPGGGATRGRKRKGDAENNGNGKNKQSVVKHEPIDDPGYLEYLQRYESMGDECIFIRTFTKADKTVFVDIAEDDDEFKISDYFDQKDQGVRDIFQCLHFDLDPKPAKGSWKRVDGRIVYSGYSAGEKSQKQKQQCKFITNKILEDLDLGSIKNAREVSKYWRLSGNSILKRRTQINFYDKYAELKQFSQETFKKQFYSGEGIPNVVRQKSYEIIGNVLLETLSTPTIAFFEEFRKYITGLSLDRWSFKPASTFGGVQNHKNLFYILTKECLQLTTLSLRQNDGMVARTFPIKDEDYEKEYRTSLVELILFNNMGNFKDCLKIILKGSPNLKYITFYCRSSSEFEDFIKALNAAPRQMRTLTLYWTQREIPYLQIIELSKYFGHISFHGVSWIPAARAAHKEEKDKGRKKKNPFPEPKDLKNLNDIYLGNSPLKYHLRIEVDELNSELIISRDRRRKAFNARKIIWEFFLLEPLKETIEKTGSKLESIDWRIEEPLTPTLAEDLAQFFSGVYDIEKLTFINPPVLDFNKIYSKFPAFFANISELRLEIDIFSMYLLRSLFDPLKSIDFERELEIFKDLKNLKIRMCSFDQRITEGIPWLNLKDLDIIEDRMARIPLERLTLSHFKFDIKWLVMAIKKDNTNLMELFVPDSIVFDDENTTLLVTDSENILPKLEAENSQ